MSASAKGQRNPGPSKAQSRARNSLPRQSQPEGAMQCGFDLFDDSNALICGVDEAGRGPLAGPVFAAAVILDPAHPIEGLRDSKKLSAERREQLAAQIRQHALAWAIAECSVAEIDEINILQASMLAMRRAVLALSVPPGLVLVDGNRCPSLPFRVEAIVKGDDKVAAISAASILAKTARDALCLELHARWPQYAFDQHKGYPTALHLQRLALHGVSEVHRRSYGPVRALLEAVNAAAGYPPASDAFLFHSPT